MAHLRTELVGTGLAGFSLRRSAAGSRRAGAPLAALALLALLFHSTPVHAQAMALGGQFDVGAGGSANYSIPVTVAPGTGGMVPALTLDYSSDGGNGLLGLGWSLGGLPSIGRCAKTIAQEGVRGAVNYDAEDRFCMEGQKLFMTSGSTYGADGTEYKTEIEGFSKIIAHGSAGNGPAWFEVKTKSGQTMEFGHTADSQILAQGKTTARSWAVSRITDTKGNYLTVTYVNDTTNGQAYPVEVNYTGNANAGLSPYNSVQFTYEDRPDVTPLYHAGSLMKTTKRLTHVKTWAGSMLINDYRLSYELSPATARSRITQIQLCAGTTPVCLPATSFAWSGQAGQSFAPTVVNPVPAANLALPGYNVGRLYVEDWNDDGLSDIFFAGITASATYRWLLGHPNATGSLQIDQYVSQASLTGLTFPFTMADYNGDGRVDLLSVAASVHPRTRVCSATSNMYIRAGAPGSLPNFTRYQNVIAGQLLVSSACVPIGLGLAEWNDDGITDVVDFATIWNNQNVWSRSQRLASGAPSYPNGQTDTIAPALLSGATSTQFADFNGDGTPDLLAHWSSTGLNKFFIGTKVGDGTLSFTQTDNLIDPTKVAGAGSLSITDINGDGLPDLFWYVQSSGVNRWFINTGAPSFQMIDAPITPSEITSGNISAGDWNNDGFPDFMWSLYGGANTWYTSQWTATGGLSFTKISNALTPADIGDNGVLYMGDWNGDGASDAMWFVANYGTNRWFVSNLPQPDLITTITTGLGVSTSLTYTPLTKSGVYTKDTDATYPRVDVIGASYVVSRVDAANGVGGVYSSSYSYAGAKSHLQGRGFLGFRQRTVTDLQTNIVQTTNYLQDYPYIGLVSSETKTLGAQTLNSTLNTYAAVDLGGTRKFPYLSESVASSWDLDGTAMPAVTTTYQYDAYGNPLTVTVAMPDGASKVTSNTYTNDTANWYLGRLTAASVTSTVP